MANRWHPELMLITDSHAQLPTTGGAALVLRSAHRSDGPALRRLALLDDAAPLAGAVLLAEQDGELRAAISLHSGRVVADPFRRTADIVALLRARAALLHAPDQAPRRPRRLLRRAARPA